MIVVHLLLEPNSLALSQVMLLLTSRAKHAVTSNSQRQADSLPVRTGEEAGVSRP
jgi:hypothetical protein